MRILMFCGLLLTMLAGCSSSPVPVYPVTGQVMLADGTPVQTGTIEFTSADGVYTARGSIERDGRFSLTTFRENDGAVAGEHRAVVVQVVSTEDLPLHDHHHGPTVDPKFGHYRRSGLSFTVQPQPNEFQVTVTAVTVPDPAKSGGPKQPR